MAKLRCSDSDAARPRLEHTIDALEARFRFSFDDLDFGFVPYRFEARGLFSVFACRPVRFSVMGDILTGYGVLPPDADAGQFATLDRMLLTRVRQGLVEMALRKRMALVGLPVSFETMTNRAAAADYLALLQKIPSDLRMYLVPALCRCPVGVPQGRLAEILNPLLRFSRAVNIRLESPRQSLSMLKTAGALSVSVDLAEVTEPEMAAPVFLNRYASVARKLGLRSFVNGVDTQAMAKLCRLAGVDYLGGRAIAELSDYVGPVSVNRSA